MWSFAGICGPVDFVEHLSQTLLGFRVSTEKSDIILMSLPLYVTWHYCFSCSFWSMFLFSIYISMLYIFNVLIIMCHGNSHFLYSLLDGLYASPTLSGRSFFRLRKFSTLILLKMFSVPLTWISSPSSIALIHINALFMVSKIFLNFHAWTYLDATFFWLT